MLLYSYYINKKTTKNKTLGAKLAYDLILSISLSKITNALISGALTIEISVQHVHEPFINKFQS